MPRDPKTFEGTSRFPTTSWTLIVNAQDLDHKVSREALGSFCGTYWYPVFAFIRRKGLDSDQARDCTQDFFTALLEKDYLAGVERSKGNFKSFLLAAVGTFFPTSLRRKERTSVGAGSGFFHWKWKTPRAFTGTRRLHQYPNSR